MYVDFLLIFELVIETIYCLVVRFQIYIIIHKCDNSIDFH